MLQQYVSRERPDVQAGFRKGKGKGKGSRNQIAKFHWIIEKARELQKNIYFYSIDYTKAFVWMTTKCGKFLKRWEYQTTLPASWEICMQVRKQQLKPDMEQHTGSKLGKEYVKAVYCHPAYLTYMQITTWEMPGLTKHKLESRFQGELSIPQICRLHHPYGRKWREIKEPLDEVKEESEKSWLKAQHSKNKNHGIWSHHFIASW